MTALFATSPDSMTNILLNNKKDLLRKALLIAGGVLVMAFASQLSVPLIPVPLTFQSSAVILIGMTYGARYGAYVMLAYLAAGLCGLPVFADFAAGPALFAGPTSGYLLGFVPAALVSGFLMQRGWARNIFTSFGAALAGVSIIFITGVAVLTNFTGSLHTALVAGVAPFLISEPIKLLVVAALATRLWKKKSA